MVPIWDADKKVTGLIDVLNKRAYELQDYKRVEIDIPDDKVDVVIDEFNEALKESVAETSEELMDKYFGGEAFTYAEMIQGLRQGVRELSMFPVLCGSAVNCMGSLMLLDYIVDLLPNPMEGNYHKATMASGETEEFVVSPGGVPTAYRVQDHLRPVRQVLLHEGPLRQHHARTCSLVNARTGATEKLGRLYTMRGKKAERGQGAGLRRHRRHRQDGQGQDRRHPLRQPEGGGPEGHPLPRALLLRGHRPQDPGPGGQGGRRAWPG